MLICSSEGGVCGCVDSTTEEQNEKPHEHLCQRFFDDSCTALEVEIVGERSHVNAMRQYRTGGALAPQLDLEAENAHDTSRSVPGMEATAAGQAVHSSGKRIQQHTPIRRDSDLQDEFNIRDHPYALLGSLWCTVGIFGFWIPLVFFVSAANVVWTCEEPLAVWMKVYSLTSLLVIPFCLSWNMYCEITKSELRHCSKYLLWLCHLGLFVNVVFGFIIHARTTEESCFDGSGINPRDLSLAFLILNIIALGVGLCGVLASSGPN